MTKSRHNHSTTELRTGTAAAASRAPTSGVGPAIETALLFILLALVPLRAVVGETHTFEVPAAFRNLDASGVASPATTFALTTIIFACAGVLLTIRLARGGPAWRWTGAEPGILVLLAGMIVSTLRAGQKHLAIIGSLDFLGILAFLIVLTQLLNRPWRIRLALTVVLATGAIVVAKCAYQRFVELPETIRYYEEHRAELLAGADETNAPFVYDYEQRLKGGAVTGYFAHPNLLASFLILIIMTSLGVAADRFRRSGGRGSRRTDEGGRGSCRAEAENGRSRRAEAEEGRSCRAHFVIVPAVVAAGASLMLVWAQSKGAAAALGIALVLWMLGSGLRPLIARRPRAAWMGLWLMLLIGATSLAGVLLTRPGALGLSMRYRSMYWQAAARMVSGEGPWGVGADNFGRFFTRYKDVECPEDVEDPHSWVMKSLCEWGIPGLAGLLLIFGGISWKLTRSCENPFSHAPPQSSCENPFSHATPRESLPANYSPPSIASSIILSAAIIGAIFFALWFCVLVGASPGFILVTLHIPLIAWFAAYILGGIERGGQRTFPDDDLSPIILTALAAGLIGFLIHSGIDLALFHAGAASTLFALCAVVLAAGRVECVSQDLPVQESALATNGMRIPASRSKASYASLLLGIILAISLMLPSYWFAVNSCCANLCLMRARQWATEVPRDWTALNWDRCTVAYQLADEEYPMDATALDELIGRRSRYIHKIEHADLVMDDAREFQRRDPHNALVWQHLATLYYQRFELARRAATSQAASRKPQVPLTDLDHSIDFMKNAVAAYPTSPNRRLQLADLLEKRAAITSLPADRRAAADELQAALDLDAKRIYISKPHRLAVAARRQIERRIDELRRKVSDQ